MRFLGLGNFIRLIHDNVFWGAFYNNIIIVVLCIIGQIGIALVIAILLYSKLLKLKEFYRTVIFFPVILSAVVVGFIWVMMYDQNMGLLDWFLRFAGLGNLARPVACRPAQRDFLDFSTCDMAVYRIFIWLLYWQPCREYRKKSLKLRILTEPAELKKAFM